MLKKVSTLWPTWSVHSTKYEDSKTPNNPHSILSRPFWWPKAVHLFIDLIGPQECLQHKISQNKQPQKWQIWMATYFRFLYGLSLAAKDHHLCFCCSFDHKQGASPTQNIRKNTHTLKCTLRRTLFHSLSCMGLYWEPRATNLLWGPPFTLCLPGVLNKLTLFFYFFLVMRAYNWGPKNIS